MIQSVKFNEYDSYEDFGLILKKKTIGSPTLKRQIIEVPATDGQIDLTDYLGGVKYGNRLLTFEFETIKRQDEFAILFSEIQNTLHGNTIKVVLSIDEDFYYLGNVTVNEWQSDRNIGKIVITVDADPFKYKKHITNFSSIVDRTGKLTANLVNLKKQVVPTITVSKETKITFSTFSTVISAGTWTLPDLLLTEGSNIVAFEAAEGTTILVSYQEGGL